jgi:hypothetical protein
VLHSLSRVASVVLTAIVLTGCGGTAAPQDPTKIIHISNRTSAVVVVLGGTTVEGDAGFRFILTACGGQAIAHPVFPAKPGEPYRVGVLIDPTGALDIAIQQANGDLNAVAVPVASMTTIWSRVQLPVAGLPQWLTITPDAVTYSDQPVTGALPTPCATWSGSPDVQALASP